MSEYVDLEFSRGSNIESNMVGTLSVFKGQWLTKAQIFTSGKHGFKLVV